MKIQSSDGRVLKVSPQDEKAVRNMIESGNHEGVEAYFKKAESESFKKGGMLKRKDGSYSRRGLWDNIRANRGSGRKPTKEMLEQEAKIRAKQAAGGTVFKGYVTEQPMGDAVPFHTSTVGEKMGKGGYTVKKSSARKGKTHVVIGPDGTKKYFGDSKLGQHPKDAKRKKAFYARHAKNLKGNPYFRAFARATWDDGGKLRLSDNMYDLGVMPYGMGGHIQEGPASHLYAPHLRESVDVRYADGGYTLNPAVYGPKGNINPYTGMINGPDTPAYNERYQYGFGGDILKGLGDIALYAADNATSLINQDIIGDKRYSDTGFGRSVKNVSHITGGIANKLAPMAAGALGGPAASMAVSAAQQASNQFVTPDQERLQSTSNQIGQGIGSALNIAGAFYNPMQAAGTMTSAGSTIAGSPAPLTTMMARYGGYTHMADGGQTGLVPINVEGANFSEGSGPDAKKGELLVLNGKIFKNYVGRPPHPAEGQNPMGDDDAPEGLIVIPKARTKEYLEAGLIKRKQMEISIVSQQRDRKMRKSKQMGDGGYYSFGMGEMGMAQGGPIGNPEEINDFTYGTMKKGGWIQKATASIKRRGTEGVCTGSKFGSSSCPPGSRRYNLAKTFRKMAKARKHELGGFVDPVTGQVPNIYGDGGQLPEGLLRTRMEASGASPEEINQYVAERYEMGGATNVTHDFPIRRLRYDVNSYVSPYTFSDFQNELRMMNPGINAQSNYVSPSAMFAAENARASMNTRAGNAARLQNFVNPAPVPVTNVAASNPYISPNFGATPVTYVTPSAMLQSPASRQYAANQAAGQRAGNIVQQAQTARMVSAPPSNYMVTPTNPYASGASGARASQASAAPAVVRGSGTPGSVSTGYMPGTRRSSGPNTPTRTAARPGTNSAARTAAPGFNPVIGATSGTSPYAQGVMSPAEYANSMGWNTPATSDFNYTGPGSFASWGPDAMRTAASPTSTFSDFLNSDQSSSPVITGPDGNQYSINPNASEADVNKFFETANQQSAGQPNWSNLATDAMRMAPVFANLIGAVSKRQYLDPNKYMQAGMKFRPGQFDRTPYETARSRAMYALRQAGAGPGYRAGVAATAAGLGQAESRDRMSWRQNELARQQQIDAMNAEIAARNIATRMGVDTTNRQIRAAAQNLGIDAASMLGQIGAENEYMRVIGGKNPRKMFTEYRNS